MGHALGAMKWVSSGKYSSFKVAYYPFTSTKEYFDDLGDLHTVWHKVLLKVADDHEFLKQLFTPLAEGDEMIRGLLSIMKKKAPVSRSDGILLDRMDYFNDETGQPKITEYNLIAVGLKQLS
jgi:glutathionylspermidine synthase